MTLNHQSDEAAYGVVSIFDCLPDHQHLSRDGKAAILIEHLLTMTCGLAWREGGTSYADPNNDAINLYVDCDDQVACVLEKPLNHEPGTHFHYSGGNLILLGEILRHATGMDFEAFAGRYLFSPPGIESAEWLRFDSGVVDAAGGLYLTPRAMTKIGLTFLRDGAWSGERIVSEEWVDRSATQYAGNRRIDIPGEASGRVGYSYSRWTKQHSVSGQKVTMYHAGGWGGQPVMILPEVDTVVVFTGGNHVTNRPDFKTLEKFVLPALD